MQDQDRRRIIEEHNARIREMATRDYYDFRAVDANEPDPRPAIEYMVERHPDPARSKKALLFEMRVHEDSWRKYNINPFGPPWGLVDSLMKLTGCFKPLYRLAARHGFSLVQRRVIAWDRRKRLADIAELQQAFLDLQQQYLGLEPSEKKKLRVHSGDQRKKILGLIRKIQEQLEGVYFAVDNTDQQRSLFDD